MIPAMKSRCFLFAVLSLLIPAGCITETTERGHTTVTTPASVMSAQLSEASANMKATWDGLVWDPRQGTGPIRWQWATAIPHDVPRAELIAAQVNGTALAQIIPEFGHQKIQLAGYSDAPQQIEISHLAAKPIHNCQDFFAAAAGAAESGKAVQCDFTETSQTERKPVAALIDAKALRALEAQVASEQPVMRLNRDGNPYVIFRRNGVSCQLTARVERSHGILQVIAALCNCSGSPKMLPVEMTATCDGHPLGCLTCAGAIERLYGPPSKKPVEPIRTSFARVSEDDEYLMPTNCRHYLDKMAERFRETVPSTQPALAAIQGTPYPGPAVLGDARAMAAFLLQRRVYATGEPEHVGWTLFGDNCLTTGEHIEIAIDLGAGVERYTLVVHKS
jgi:hypothetical protein